MERGAAPRESGLQEKLSPVVIDRESSWFKREVCDDRHYGVRSGDRGAGQYEITIRVANGEVELCQEDDLINLRPENALKLIRAVLRAIGMDDVHLHKQDGGLCYDVDLPDDRVVTGLRAESGETRPSAWEKPKDRTAAERQRRYRERKRNTEDVTGGHNAVTDEPELRFGRTE